MYKSMGRRKAEYEIFEKLERDFCNPQFFKNPRIIDVVDQIEQACIKMYQYDASYIDDETVYIRKVLPLIQMLIHNPHSFKINEEGNIRIALPLLQEDDRGNHVTQKDIQFNMIKGKMEKVTILDYRRYGIDRVFKSTRYVYDQNGIEMQREIQMLRRDEERVKTIYWFLDRLGGKPTIVKMTKNSKPTRENGQISYYNIQHSRNIEDLEVDEKQPIEETDIKELTPKEREKIIKNTIQIYQKGMMNLMGIQPEQEVR